MKLLLVLLLVTMSVSAVYADCWYNGRTYPEGTVIGPYVCSDGKWVAR